MADFFITTTHCSIQERTTKRYGTVYDVMFRIINKEGEEMQKKLSGFPTKTAAKQAHAQFITDQCELVPRGTFVRRKKPTTNSAPKVHELIDEYISTLGNHNKESSIIDKRRCYNQWVIPSLGDLRISELTEDCLYRWQDKMWNSENERTGEYYSYAYCDKIRAHLNAFLSWVETRYKYPNNLANVKKPKRRMAKSKMQIWTREEFESFIATVDDPVYHCFFVLAFFTGRRLGELLALTPEDIGRKTLVVEKSLSRRTLDDSAYRITSTKAEKKQTVPICDTVRKELTEYKKWRRANEIEGSFLLGGTRPIPENTLRRYFNIHAAEAGLKQIRIHDLRHSFVSMLIHLGANWAVIADLIGDTMQQVVQTYGHLYDSDKFDVVSKIG